MNLEVRKIDMCLYALGWVRSNGEFDIIWYSNSEQDCHDKLERREEYHKQPTYIDIGLPNIASLF